MTQPNITINEVARMAGVAPATVSRVLNNYPGVRPETRRRVQQVVDQLGYRPNAMARTLASDRSQTVGLYVAEHFLEEHLMPFILGMTDELRDRGYHLLLISERSPAAIVSLYRERRIDGVVLVAPTSMVVFELVRANVPFSLMGKLTNDDPVLDAHLRGANVDNVGSGMLAAEHLVGLGHTSLVFVGPDTDLPYVDERRRGFEDTVRQLAVTPCRVDSILQREGLPLFRQLLKLLREDAPPTALFCSSWSLLPDIMRAVKAADMEIPRDLSVITYGPQDRVSYEQSFWSIIRDPTGDLGQQSTKALLDFLDDPDPTVVSKVLLKPTVHAGSSTAPWVPL